MKPIKMIAYATLVLSLLSTASPVGAASGGSRVPLSPSLAAGAATQHGVSIESSEHSAASDIRPPFIDSGNRLDFSQTARNGRGALSVLWIGLGIVLFGAALFISISEMFTKEEKANPHHCLEGRERK